jgi:hypothetical protein
VCCRPHSSERGEPAVPAMKCQQFMQVKIGDSIAPSQHEDTSAGIWGEAFNSAAGCVSIPVSVPRSSLLRATTNLYPSRCRGDCQVKIERTVVDYVFLDDFALIAQRDDKASETIMSVMHHDVPEYRFYHRSPP